jgi:hypothetical protein
MGTGKRRAFLAALARTIIRWPIAFVATSLALAVVAGAYAVSRLEFRTSRNDLIGRESQYWRNYSEYAREFRDEEDYIILAEGNDPSRNQAAIDALAAALLLPANNPHPDDDDEAQTFASEDVFARADLDLLQQRFLYFLSTNDLAGIRDSVREFKQLVAVLQANPELATFFDAMNQMLQQMEIAPEAQRRRMEAFLPTVCAILRQMAEFRGENAPSGLLSPWASAFFSEEMLRQAEEQMRWKGYNAFANGTMFLMLVHPNDGDKGAASHAATVPKIRRIIAEVAPEFPDVKIGLTGEPVLDLDEMETSQRDAMWATILTLALCGLLFVTGFREWLRPILATACLVLILALSLGWATLAVGHLNIITVTFAVMIIGLGIDLGIQIIARYEEELSRGAPRQQAVATSIEHTGPSIITAALTNAGAFFAMGLSGFRGVVELGIIAGGGMILALLVMLLALPALLLMVRRKRESSHIPAQAAATRLERTLVGKPVATIAVCAALTVAALVAGSRVRFDYNVLNLQSSRLESVAVEQRLLATDAQSTIFAAVVCDDLEQARRLHAQLETKTGTVSSVVSIAALLPENQPEKAAIIRDIQIELGNPQLQVAAAATTDPQQLLRALQSLQLRAGKLARDAAERNDESSRKALISLADAITQTRQALGAAEPVELGRPMAQYQRLFYADLQAQLQLMAQQVVDRPMTLDDVPREIRGMLQSKSSRKFLIRVFPRHNIWDRAPLERFVADVQSVAPKATGTPLGIYEFIAILQRGYIEAALWAFLAIAALVMADFRRVLATVLTLAPLVVGIIWMVGAMGLAGIRFNPANIMTLPLIVGIGVAYGVYVVQRYREDGGTDFYGKSTGRAVLLSALTTIVGFGSLMIGQHRGIFTLGLVMSIGVAACLATSLTLLPALLKLASRKGWKL